MDDKTVLSRKRRSLKSAFTRAQKNLTKAVDTDRPKTEVIEKFKKLSDIFDEISEVHQELTLLVSDSEYPDYEAWIDNVSEIFDESTIAYHDYVGEQQTTSNQTGQNQTSNNTTNTTTTTGQQHVQLRQEKAPLPKFDGSDVLNYCDFKDDFNYIVEGKYSDRDALYLLKQCTKGKAREWIQGETEYNQAWETLDNEYNDARLLSKELTEKLDKIKPMQEYDRRLENVYHLVKKAEKLLTLVKRPHDIDNLTMLDNIIGKFVRDDRIKWAEYQKANGEPSIKLLLKWIHHVLWVRKIAGVHPTKTVNCSTNVVEQTTPAASSTAVTPPESVTADADVTVGQANVKWEPKCWYCKETGHWIQECSKFKTLQVVQRLDETKKVRACFSCLRIHRGKCNRRSKCTIKINDTDCKYTHHPLLHGAFEATSGTVGHASCETDSKLLPVITLECSNPVTKNSFEGNILFDSGSQLSLIDQKFAQCLGLIGESMSLNIIKVGGTEEFVQSTRYKVEITSQDGKKYMVTLLSIPKIADSPQFSVENLTKQFSLEPGEVRRKFGPIHILIGVDHPQFHTGDTVISDNLALKRTILGNVIFGSTATVSGSVSHGVSCFHISVPTPVDLTEFWDSEQMGVAINPCCKAQNPREKHLSDIEKFEEKLIRDSARKVGDRWLIPYPWLRDPNDLPDNYAQAYAKLCSTERRLAQHPEGARQYNDQIQDLVARGCARKLTEEEIRDYSGPLHYNSHHVVIRLDKTSTPFRLVFNPAEKFQGKSLNDFLRKGPDLLNPILGVLTRFRENSVAFVGDVSKMYHQVLVDPQVDAHTHRFLWRDFEVDRSPDVYVKTVLTFGDKPSPAMANIAMDMTAEAQAQNFPEASKVIIESRYMDDITDSRSTVSEVRQLTGQIEHVLATGHFTIKHWLSNEPLTTDDENKVVSLPQSDEKVLGITWDRESDVLSIRANPLKALRGGEGQDVEWKIPETLTKRMVLGVIAGIYDLFGLVTPVTIIGKVGIQDLWKGNYQWDDPLPEHLVRFWSKWILDLEKLKDVQFPRCLTPAGAIGNPTLVIFSDASEKAFGAVAYCRWQLENGRYECRFIMAKSRVAPVKSSLSIPKLELQGMVIGSRLKQTIMSDCRFQWEKTVFFCDSKVALAWVQNESREYKPFVSARVSEITRAVDRSEFKYCKSEINVADDLSRGLKPEELSGRWMYGPDFLQLPEEEWPESVPDCINNYEQKLIQQEMRKGSFVGVTTRSKSKHQATEPVWEHMAKYSTLDKAVRVTAWVLRAINNLRKNSIKVKTNTLLPSELRAAEKTLVINAQRSVQKGQYTSLGPKTDDDGIIRVGGRANNAQVSYDMRHPPLIPGGHWLGKLILRKAHTFGHLGVAATVGKARRKYWVVRATKTAQSIKHQCVFCREMDAQTENQQMASLPKNRLKPHTPPFYATSVDYFGPYTVKFSKYKTDKVWGVLYTCLNVRAVYIDVASDYSAEGFLMTFRRFLAMHGQPKFLYSDRGSNLVGADRELREFCNSKGMEWHFLTPTAAHQNGCAESMIRTTKRCLKQAIGKKILWPMELQTVFFEVANLVNQRPIGKLPTDPDDGKYLAPNDLLLGRSSNEIPQGPFEDDNNEMKRFSFVQTIINDWWKQWYRDVFPLLIPRRKWNALSRNVSVGDFVIIKDPDPLRSVWNKGKVTKVFPGTDGRVRNVEVKTSTGTYERPITRIVVLYPIEGYENED